LDRKARSRRQPPRVLRFKSVDVGAVAMNLFTDRMSGPMNEPCAMPGRFDDIAASRVNFIPEGAAARKHRGPHEFQCCVTAPFDDAEHRAMLLRDGGPRISGPRRIATHRARGAVA